MKSLVLSLIFTSALFFTSVAQSQPRPQPTDEYYRPNLIRWFITETEDAVVPADVMELIRKHASLNNISAAQTTKVSSMLKPFYSSKLTSGDKLRFLDWHYENSSWSRIIPRHYLDQLKKTLSN